MASELTRIRKGHRRAMSWMKTNAGKTMPAHIKRGLNEFHALEELRLQQQDKRLLAEWEADSRPVEEKGPPPLPTGRQVVIPPHLAKGLINALAELNEEEKANGLATGDTA